ncbi:succinylglutamate desuccinylase/aspartoacylase family protein [Chloroflexota bacterium]
MSGEVWQLGPLKVEPGQTLRGVFPVDLGAATIDFPIALVNGVEPDPVVLVTAGMDGDEHAAIEAALRLIDGLDATKLAGRVMICPVLDPLSFEAQKNQNPLDGLFLKNVFPGDLDGKPTQRLAHFIYHNFLVHADAWVSLHVNNVNEEAQPFVWTYQGDDAQINEQNNLLLRSSGAEIALSKAPYTWEPAQHILTASTALVAAQAGCSYQSDESATEFHLHVIQNVLQGMDMLHQEAAPPPQVFLHSEKLLADATGLWYPRVQAGAEVSSGQIIGEVFKLDGSSALQTVTSPFAGVALSIHTGLATRPRQQVALIANRRQHPPTTEG